MELSIFITLLLISLVLITLGLFKSEHTELSLVGFLFLFLLSLIILNTNISYKTGENTTLIYEYESAHPADHIVNRTYEYKAYTYDTYTDRDWGYWLAICSVVGFIGVLVSLKPQRFLK